VATKKHSSTRVKVPVVVAFAVAAMLIFVGCAVISALSKYSSSPAQVTIYGETTTSKRATPITVNSLNSVMLHLPELDGAGNLSWHVLQYAMDGLIVLSDNDYLIVVRKIDKTWFVTHRVNPDPTFHFRYQGSTLSCVETDVDEGHIVIHPRGMDYPNEPYYVLDLDSSELTSYSPALFPYKRDTHSASNVIWHEDVPASYDRDTNTVTFNGDDLHSNLKVKLAYEPVDRSVYLYDENTLAYLAAGWHMYFVCFQDIHTGRVSTIRVI